MLRNIKYRDVKDSFQTKLIEDINTIKNSSKLHNFADKTDNLYSLSKEDHNKLLMENVTKTYQKAPEKLMDSINL